MTTKQDRIRAVLDQYGVEWDKDSVWAVQGTPVILHKTLEQIAAKAGVRWDLPVIVRAADNEAVIMCVGRLGDKQEWSIGEARISLMVPDPSGKMNNWGKPEMIRANDEDWGNYVVSGKQASYPWAMAEKRAKDRVILKLIELSGFAYSEAESDDFTRRDQPSTPAPAPAVDELAAAEKKVLDAIARQGWTLVLFDEFCGKPGVQNLLKDLPTERAEALREAITVQRGRLAASAGQAPSAPAKPEAGTEAIPDEATSRTSVIDPDPYHVSNLNTLSNSIGSAIFSASTPEQVEDGIEAVLSERGLDWDKLEQKWRDKIDSVADLKIKSLQPVKKGRKS